MRSSLEMRAVVQRVSQARVLVGEEVTGSIGPGLCVLVGVAQNDVEKDAEQLARKIVGLRIFGDDQGRMNLSLLDLGYDLLAVSQFTLHGDVRKGKRPNFMQAMAPEPARRLFDSFCHACQREGVNVATGRFGAEMKVELLADGPVTILLDTEQLASK